MCVSTVYSVLSQILWTILTVGFEHWNGKTKVNIYTKFFKEKAGLLVRPDGVNTSPAILTQVEIHTFIDVPLAGSSGKTLRADAVVRAESLQAGSTIQTRVAGAFQLVQR